MSVKWAGRVEERKVVTTRTSCNRSAKTSMRVHCSIVSKHDLTSTLTKYKRGLWRRARPSVSPLIKRAQILQRTHNDPSGSDAACRKAFSRG